jgi:hypothetical protein
VKLSAVTGRLVPSGVVTMTSTRAAAWPGETAVICVAELTAKLVAPLEPKLMLVAATRPNETALAPVKPVPVIVTGKAPVVTPARGLSRLTVGVASYMSSSSAVTAVEPTGVVTATSTMLAAWGGVVALIEVPEVTEYELAATRPNETALVPLKPVPVMVTVVGPAVRATAGLTALIVGPSS